MLWQYAEKIQLYDLQAGSIPVKITELADEPPHNSMKCTASPNLKDGCPVNTTHGVRISQLNRSEIKQVSITRSFTRTVSVTQSNYLHSRGSRVGVSECKITAVKSLQATTTSNWTDISLLQNDHITLSQQTLATLL